MTEANRFPVAAPPALTSVVAARSVSGAPGHTLMKPAPPRGSPVSGRHSREPRPNNGVQDEGAQLDDLYLFPVSCPAPCRTLYSSSCHFLALHTMDLRAFKRSSLDASVGKN